MTLKDYLNFKASALLAFGVGVLFFLLNAWLKSRGLGDSSLYLDEAFSVYYGQQSPDVILGLMDREPNPPGYFLTLHYWIELFGIGPEATRSLSVVFSSLTSLLLVRIGNRNGSLFFGVLSALFFTCSSIQFDYAQEIRGFAMASFFMAVSLSYFLTLMREQSPKAIVGMMVANVILLHLHFATFLVPLLQTFILLGYWKIFVKVWKHYLIVGGLALCAFLPMLLTFTADKMGRTGGWLKAPAWNEIIPMFEKLYGGSWVLLVGGILLVFAFVQHLRHKSKCGLQPLWILLVGSVGTVLAGWLVSQKVPFFVSKYLLFTSIAFFVFMAWAIHQLQLAAWIKFSIATLCVSIMLLDADFVRVSPENWKEAVATAKQLRVDDDTYIIVSPSYEFQPFTYYYDRDLFQVGDRLELVTRLKAEEQVICTGGIRLKKFFPEGLPQSLITVQLNQNRSAKTAKNLKKLAPFYQEVAKKMLKGVEVRKFERKP